MISRQQQSINKVTWFCLPNGLPLSRERRETFSNLPYLHAPPVGCSGLAGNVGLADFRYRQTSTDLPRQLI